MPEHRDFAYIRSFGSLLLSFRIFIKKINIQRTLCWVDKLNVARKTSVVPLESESLNFKGRPICNNQCLLQYKFVRENPRGIFADSKYVSTVNKREKKLKERVNLTLLYVPLVFPKTLFIFHFFTIVYISHTFWYAFYAQFYSPHAPRAFQNVNKTDRNWRTKQLTWQDTTLGSCCCRRCTVPSWLGIKLEKKAFVLRFSRVYLSKWVT